MKYNGKTNNFGDVISLEKTKTKIIVNSDVPFSKKYVTIIEYQIVLQLSLI